jgi:hypothetical protein
MKIKNDRFDIISQRVFGGNKTMIWKMKYEMQLYKCSFTNAAFLRVSSAGKLHWRSSEKLHFVDS